MPEAQVLNLSGGSRGLTEFLVQELDLGGENNLMLGPHQLDLLTLLSVLSQTLEVPFAELGLR